MNSNGKIGLDYTGIDGVARSERPRMTRVVESHEGGRKVIVSRPKSFKSAYDRRRHLKTMSMLLVGVAVIMTVSAFALTPGSTEKASSMAPGPPHTIAGYTRASGGAGLGGCSVVITDKRTGESGAAVISMTSPAGLYQFEMATLVNGYLDADTLNITATKGTAIGWNETTGHLFTGSFTWLNVTLNHTISAIPEFTDIVVPIVGMISVFAVARVALNRSKEE